MKLRLFKKMLKEIAIMKLNSGDVVVVSVKNDRIFKQEELAHISEEIKYFFPNNKVMIVPVDFDIKIIQET